MKDRISQDRPGRERISRRDFMLSATAATVCLAGHGHATAVAGGQKGLASELSDCLARCLALQALDPALQRPRLLGKLLRRLQEFTWMGLQGGCSLGEQVKLPLDVCFCPAPGHGLYAAQSGANTRLADDLEEPNLTSEV